MRVVLDTNVVVSALVFERGSLSWLRPAWLRRQFTPLVDADTVTELLRTLAYPKFGLHERDIEALLEDYLPYVEIVVPRRAAGARLPHARDPEDQKFLALAARGRADALVTGDKALLGLAGRTRFAIESPAAFRLRLGA